MHSFYSEAHREKILEGKMRKMTASWPIKSNSLLNFTVARIMSTTLKIGI